MFTVRECGDWGPGDVIVRWTPSRRAICSQIDRAIEEAWRRESARLGEKLFAGPMGRLEGLVASQPELIFVTTSTLSRAQVESRLNEAEHVSTYAVPADATKVNRAIADSALTPVAAACLMLWNRRQRDLPHG